MIRDQENQEPQEACRCFKHEFPSLFLAKVGELSDETLKYCCFILWIYILYIVYEKSFKLILDVKSEMQIKIEKLICPGWKLIMGLLGDRAKCPLKIILVYAQRLYR